ncbi:MAG: hypothetical protein QGG80_00075 [Candidatus Krumholzibacteria bacterium]|jgi:YVTN family beta-propeller protein|nr:hypothetical protein [Candidatus Krumholzibacteria bacterium]MDP6797812.1 hypothetical protein [Candidatus Krumholzibacteria bacterium]MDP7021395.1 hypothetical protein [Candidatus Krumholzibacteria bacterium]
MKRVFLLLIFLLLSCAKEPPSPYRLYVPQFRLPDGLGRVWVYSVPDLRPLKNIPAGNVCARLAVSPDGKEAWVSCEGSRDLLLIDCRSDSALSRIPAGRTVQGGAFSPDGKLFAVSHSAVVAFQLKEAKVSLYRVEDRQRLVTLEVGEDPRSLVFSPDGLRLFVANLGENTISVIDVPGRAVVEVHPTGPAPHDLSLDPLGGELAVACLGLPGERARRQGELVFHRLEDLSILRRFPAGRHPSRVHYLPDASGFWLGEMGGPDSADDLLSFYPRGSEEAARTLSIGRNPQLGQISPDGRWMALTVAGGSEVLVLDLALEKVVARQKLPDSEQSRFAVDAAFVGN